MSATVTCGVGLLLERASASTQVSTSTWLSRKDEICKLLKVYVQEPILDKLIDDLDDYVSDQIDEIKSNEDYRTEW